MAQPTIYIVMGEPPDMASAIAYDEAGEVVETIVWADGLPDWRDAGICDPRGPGGLEGFQQLITALDAMEANARVVGFDPIMRVSGERP